MTDPTTDDSPPEPEWDERATPGPSVCPRSGLLAIVVNRGGRQSCTIYPPDVATPFRTTTWITAHEGAFVDLEACR